jgi:glutamate dehydrogenase (NAD(P)+)
MAKSYRDVSQLAKSRQVSWRTAAYILALGRVAKATVMRGI